MNPLIILKKTIVLLGELNNPPFFWYSLHHYLKKDVLLKTAKKIAKKNRESYLEEEKEYIIHTYDGSDQCVHPDTLSFDNKIWLVATPYPYGMEEYENPCIYFGAEIYSLNECSNNPIDLQQKHEIGFHLSDPCIFELEGNVICLYRENVRQNGKEKNIIKYKCMRENGVWSESKIVIKSDTDPLLSPAVYVEDNGICKYPIMVHVNRQKNSSRLVLTELNDDMTIVASRELNCTCIPDDYYVWHIAIAFYEGRKKGLIDETKYGLFLLRNSIQADDFKLCYASFVDDNTWEVKKEVEVPASIKQNILHPYKSCFIANTNEILFSYVDIKHRYRLTIIK